MKQKDKKPVRRSKLVNSPTSKLHNYRPKKLTGKEKEEIKGAVKQYDSLRSTIKDLTGQQKDVSEELKRMLTDRGVLSPDGKETTFPDIAEDDGFGLSIKLIHPDDSYSIDEAKAEVMLPSALLKQCRKTVIDPKMIAQLVDEGKISSAMFSKITNRKKNSPRIDVRTKPTA